MIRTPLSTVIGGAFWTPSCTVIGGAKLISETVMKKLFANGEQGFFYDPSDLSTMFQDAAGTIPVTAAGQPVGLMLDKSKGLVLGLETNTNASFNDWSGGKPVGYNLFKNDTTTFIEQSINGVRMRSTDGANVQLTRGIAAGKYYEVVINVDSLLSGSVALESQGTRVKLIASSGVHTFRFYALSTGLDLKRGGGVTDFTIRSLSIKELAGNHAYSTTSASRPILRKNAVTGANYLEFDGSDDSLQTNNINFTATNNVSLFAGVRKLRDASTAVLCELSDNSTNINGTFALFAPTTPNALYQFRSKGTLATVFAMSPANTYPAPHTAVLTGLGSTALNLAVLRLNGVQLDSRRTAQGVRVYGNYPLYIGRRAGTSLPFNGHLYSLIGVGKLVSEDEVVAIEKELAKQTGVAL